MQHSASKATTHAARGAYYCTSPDVVVEKLGDAMIAVQLGTDQILELNETAARLVELLLEGRSDADATAALADEYGVASEVVAPDVAETIAMLVAQQVLEQIDAASATTASESAV